MPVNTLETCLYVCLIVCPIGEVFPSQGSWYSGVGQSPDTALEAAPHSFGGEWKSTANRPYSERDHTPYFTFIKVQVEDICEKNFHHSPL